MAEGPDAQRYLSVVLALMEEREMVNQIAESMLGWRGVIGMNCQLLWTSHKRVALMGQPVTSSMIRLLIFLESQILMICILMVLDLL